MQSPLGRQGAKNANPPQYLFATIERLETRQDLTIDEWFERLQSIAAEYFRDRIPNSYTLEEPGSIQKQLVMRHRVKFGNRTDHPLDKHLTPDREAYRDELRRSFLESITFSQGVA